jgi:diaminopimelate epimerase
MRLNFTKMQGLGNDFVVFDAISQKIELTPKQIRLIADRHFGIGCDQVLLVESPTQNVDFKYRIFNADGSEVEQCGNGARCFARFVREKQLTDKKNIVVETFNGIIRLLVDEHEMVTVDMGQPVFIPQQLPFIPTGNDSWHNNDYSLEVNLAETSLSKKIKIIKFSAVSMGNPHITIRVDDIDQYPVEQVGKILESHSNFPNRINVGFMQIINPQQIRLRVYERGSGETMACGTGACAAVANGIFHNWLGSKVTVKLAAGNLKIQWQQKDNPLMMTGSANFVYEGQITL